MGFGIVGGGSLNHPLKKNLAKNPSPKMISEMTFIANSSKGMAMPPGTGYPDLLHRPIEALQWHGHATWHGVLVRDLWNCLELRPTSPYPSFLPRLVDFLIS